MSANYGKCYTLDSNITEVYCDLQNNGDSHNKVFTMEPSEVEIRKGLTKVYPSDPNIADSPCNLRKITETAGRNITFDPKTNNYSDIQNTDDKISVDSTFMTPCNLNQTEGTNAKSFTLDTVDIEGHKDALTESNIKVYSMNSSISEHPDGIQMKGESHGKIFTVDSVVTEPPCGLQKKQNGNWYCDICGLEEPLKDDILTHRILHLSDDHSKQCPICEKKFSSSTSLRNHLTVHTGIKKFRCKYCGRKFGWKTQLVIHENLHTGKGLHHCHVCSKSFMTKWLLQRHLKIHLKNNRKCDDYQNNKWDNSPKSTTTQVYDNFLEINADTCVTSLSIESQSAKFPRCRECNQSFKTEDRLAYHLLEHNSSKHNMKYNVSIKKQTSLDETSDRNCDISLINWSTSRFGNDGNHLLDSIDQEKLKIKNPSKGSLTSIVSKLHHKVDEKQKSENEENEVLQESGKHNLNSNLKESGVCSLKGVMNSDIKLDALPKDISKQQMSTSSDPFISGIIEVGRNRESGFITNNSSIQSTYASKGKDIEQQCISELPLSDTEMSRHISKQSDIFQNEMRRYFVRHEKELASLQSTITTLHGKVDSLTNIVTSQSLIINRLFLGGKMAVNGLLDFNVRSSGGE